MLTAIAPAAAAADAPTKRYLGWNRTMTNDKASESPFHLIPTPLESPFCCSSRDSPYCGDVLYSIVLLNKLRSERSESAIVSVGLSVIIQLTTSRVEPSIRDP